MSEPIAASRRRVKVLVFPCGSEIGLEIHHALSSSTHVEIIGASSVESNHGAYLYRRYFDGLPMIGDPAFIPALNALIDRTKADFVYPAHDSVVLELARRKREINAPVIGSPLETCETCRSKGATYRAFAGRLRVPAVYSPAQEDLPFPLFLKPDVGQGSKGVHRVDAVEQVRFRLAEDQSLLCLEYLPGEEYTVDCFTDRHRRLRFAGARERLRIAGGIAVDTRPVEGEVFQRLAGIVNDALVLRGAWFFQLKRAADGELALLEIAPRVSGSMGLYRNLGVNLPLLSVYDREGGEVEILPERHGLRMDRALFSRFRTDLRYQHVYVDLDDTLLIDGKVNPLLAAFLFQCRNNSIEVHLLTRHAGDLEKTLRFHALTALFDTVTHLREAGQSKSDCIVQRPAILIDDSFAERKSVRERCGIPTFATDAVESLIDWSR